MCHDGLTAVVDHCSEPRILRAVVSYPDARVLSRTPPPRLLERRLSCHCALASEKLCNNAAIRRCVRRTRRSEKLVCTRPTRSLEPRLQRASCYMQLSRPDGSQRDTKPGVEVTASTPYATSTSVFGIQSSLWVTWCAVLCSWEKRLRRGGDWGVRADAARLCAARHLLE